MLNKVQLIGRLGGDPEVRRLESGVAVARLNVATNETYRDKDGNKQEVTEWITVVCWRGLAEIAEKYLKKGSMIYAEGKLSTRTWQTESGENRRFTEVVANNFIMLDRKEGGSGGGMNRPPMPGENDQPPYAPRVNDTNNTTPPTDEPMPVDDDLPF